MRSIRFKVTIDSFLVIQHVRARTLAHTSTERDTHTPNQGVIA